MLVVVVVVYCDCFGLYCLFCVLCFGCEWVEVVGGVYYYWFVGGWF